MLIVLANIALKRRYASEYDEAVRNRNQLRLFLPLSLGIYGFLDRLGKGDVFGSKTTLSHLNVNGDIKDILKKNACSVLSYVQLGILVTYFLTVICTLGNKNPLMDGARLERPKTGDGVMEYELVADVGDDLGEVPVTIEVNEQKCDKAEMDKFFATACERLEQEVTDGNASPEQITGSLNLISSIPGTSITVEWLDMDYSLIYPDGTILHDHIENPVIVYLTARLKYFDEEKIYSFPVRLMPEEKSASAVFLEKLGMQLTELDTEQSEEAYLTLPGEVDGMQVSWKAADSKTEVKISVLGMLAVAAVIPGWRFELKKREKERSSQMMRDYTDIISKFILLITAGMTCRSAWEKICSDYSEHRTDSDPEKFAYEEMIKSCRELKLGLPEAEVYDRFGERCGVTAYQRFGTILSRNLKRGSRDMLMVLEEESQDAFSERREAVKQKGEEVGTKLLIPMMGMLCIVIAIVVVPAFTGFT